ncbi:MAG TPA: sulfurtransferase TusA family protein [Acidothermaceae bacterium]
MTTNANVLDNRRTPCAVGLIRAAQAMHELQPGSKLEIWSRDVFAPMEIPLWASRDGYRVESRARAGIWPWRFHVFIVAR